MKNNRSHVLAALAPVLSRRCGTGSHPAEACRRMRIYPLHTPSGLTSSRQESFESIPRHPDDKFRALLRCGLGVYSRLELAFLRAERTCSIRKITDVRF
ncbi:hypothetical protein XBI1_780013 [Xenorhabdus bovienii str. Intermedium]|uniref:Uncharacterized protein n=1 Tax=Xenorhabdus bovienii str. Intermedium TaxID=1379677 RepID=A0A077QG96_XENBV|nr:hypothetical protein XBI1_780013 [Xenorhabdus bovienii str. Intermedium]